LEGSLEGTDRAASPRSGGRTIAEVPADIETALLERPNRFLGIADVAGVPQRVHIPDPGRLSELLYPGARILLKRAPRPRNRSTDWTLMAAGSPAGGWVLTNTFLHRRISKSLLSGPSKIFAGATDLRAEVAVGDSRLDFLLTEPEGVKRYVEVKGCTLVRHGVGLFPDAPTVRGRRHMEELTGLVEDGYAASVLFLLFGDTTLVGPNPAADPDFCSAYWKAINAGVTVHSRRIAYDGKRILDLGPGGCLIRA